MKNSIDRLGEHLDFSNGRSSPSRSEEGRFPVFGSNGLIGYADKANAPGQTVVIGRVGSYCGSLHFSKGESWVTDNAIKATAKKSSESRFWYYALSNINLNDLSSGSGQPLINQTALKAVELPIPKSNDRLKIGKILGNLDDKIENNQRMSETLEAMAQAIFKDWFVDFGPVYRKLSGMTDPVTILGGLITDLEKAAQTAALFPDAFDDNGFPEGWEVGTLGALAATISTTVDPATLPKNTPYIGLEHMPRGSIMLDQWGHASDVSSRKALFKQGNILFGKLRPYFHKVGIAAFDGISSTDIVVLDAIRANDHALVSSCVSSSDFVSFTNQDSDGTKMPRTSWAKMKRYSVALADIPVRNRFESLAGPMLEKIVGSIEENKTLAETRDYLLPRFMSGQIRANAVEDVAA